MNLRILIRQNQSQWDLLRLAKVERERMEAFERMKMTGGAEEKTRGKPLDQFAKCKTWMWR